MRDTTHNGNIGTDELTSITSKASREPIPAERSTMRAPIRAKIAGAWKQATLTTEHSSSSYGIPVVIVKGENFARGSAEVDEIAVPAQHKEAAERGRYQISQTTTRYHDNDMPHELHLQATIAAKTAGKSLKVWVREAIQEKLSREKIMTKTYRIVFADNTGSRAVDAIASSCGGQWRNCAQRFNGEHDLAFVEVPTDNAEYLEEMLDADENVVSYQEA